MKDHKVMRALRNNIAKDLRHITDTLRNIDHYPELKVALACDTFVVYSVMGCSFDTVEGFYQLESMIINGLYDDASLKVERVDNHWGSGVFSSYKIVFGGDDYRSLLGEELVHLLSLRQKEQDYYSNNSEAIENRYSNEGGKLFLSNEAREYSRLIRESKNYFEHLWNLQEELRVKYE